MSDFAFNSVPMIRHSRSRFDLSHGIKTSANVGTLYPFEVQEVYAGDTFKVKTSVVSRLSSQFFRPVMDNLFLDVYYFFVPSRLLYDKFVNVFGENTDSAWANTVEYDVPTITSGSVPEKTVGDYLGLPTGMQISNVSVLPFRAFAKIYNEWFRDQNNIDPMHIQTGEVAASEVFNSNAWSPSNYMGQLPKVAKFHDYFTTCLPAPQKGSATDITITGGSNLPVFSGTSNNVNNPESLRFRSASAPSSPGLYPLGASVQVGSLPQLVSVAGDTLAGSLYDAYPDNLWADTSNGVGTISVNDLRFAFQYQKMLERDARSGTRYVEYLASHFGVFAGDYRLQRSEFLGGRRTPLSIHQVTQTTGSDESSTNKLGEVGAFSLSNGRSRFTKSFVEHGFVLGVFCIRQHHTYQQGIERFWKRSKRVDFFDPVFSNIGEQPVYKTELFGSATSSGDGAVFGYNEAWADLRFRPNRVTGQMRSNATDSLDFWHFADNYTNAPTLSKNFIEETPQYVNRTISVESKDQDQFILDFWVQNIAYRPLPAYSIASLIDHN